MEQTKPTFKCTARAHLRGADFATYDAAMALTAHSDGKRVLSASKRRLSAMTGYSERTVGFARIRLVDSGWLNAISSTWKEDQRRTGKAGNFSTPRFEVVEHKEWAKLHPGLCMTVYLFSVHGRSVHADTEHAETTDTVHGRATDTVHGQQVSNALVLKPKKKSKGVAASAASPVNVRSKAWLEWWGKKYERKYRESPTISWAKNTAQLRPLLEQNSDSTVKAAAEAYLSDTTSFTTGHPFGIFIAQFDKWRASARDEGDAGDFDDSSDVTVEDIRPPGFVPDYAKKR